MIPNVIDFSGMKRSNWIIKGKIQATFLKYSVWLNVFQSLDVEHTNWLSNSLYRITSSPQTLFQLFIILTET